MSKVKHVVLIRFKESASPEVISNLFEELLEVTESIPGIEDYVTGPNNSPEGLNDGYSHGIVMTFTDAAARDAYLPHPEHERVVVKFKEQVEKFIVFDFEV